MFDQESITIARTSDARKESIQEEQAWTLLKSAREIIVGRGRKSVVFDPAIDDRESILKQSLGRSGNLRAPTLKLGDRLLIGFNEAMYNQYLG